MVPGRTFPVKVVHRDLIKTLETTATNYVAKAVDVVMDIHTEQPPGVVHWFKH